MEQEVQVATPRTEHEELDELYAAIGKESPRMVAAREAKEAEEARALELKELEVKELSRYVDELLPRSYGARVGDEMDQAYNAVADVWGRLKGAISDKREAVKDIEALTRTFGGALPPAWQEARSAWIERQPRRDQPSASVTWRRDRFSKLMQTLFGRL